MVSTDGIRERRGHGSAGVPPACKKKIAGETPAFLLSLALNLRAKCPQISLFTRRRGSPRSRVHAMSVLLCLLCFTFPAFAQGDVSFVGRDNIGMDVSFQLNTVTIPTGAFRGLGGIGGRVGYYLGSFVFLDGEILQQFTGCLVEICNNEKVTILGGARFGTIFDDSIGVFAKARVGAFGFRAKYDVISEKSFYPVFDIGIIVERYYNNNFFTRIDLGNWIIPFGDTKVLTYELGQPDEQGNIPVTGTNYTRIGTKHNFAVGLGLGFRF